MLDKITEGLVILVLILLIVSGAQYYKLKIANTEITNTHKELAEVTSSLENLRKSVEVSNTVILENNTNKERVDAKKAKTKKKQGDIIDAKTSERIITNELHNSMWSVYCEASPDSVGCSPENPINIM